MALGDWVQQEIEIHAKILPALDWHRLSTYLIFYLTIIKIALSSRIGAEAK